MAKTSTKQTEDEELKEHRQNRVALLSEAHAIAVKQFGADVSPKISSEIFSYMTEDEDQNAQLVEDIARAAALAVEIYGNKTAEVALSVFEDIYVADDE